LMAGIMAGIMAFISSAPAGAQETDGLIFVTGTGVVTAPPDVFLLDVSVSLRDPDLDKVQDEVRERCGRIVKAARQFQLDMARTFTRDYRIVPQYDNLQHFIGYSVSQQFQFALTDLNQAEALTTAVLKSGATTINEIAFSVTDHEELREQARVKAMEHALARAKRMARAVGSSPGRPRSITDRASETIFLGCAWDGSEPAPQTSEGAGLAESDRVFFVPPTAVKFQAQVQVQFAIEPL
jgi:uncharacterized protein